MPTADGSLPGWRRTPAAADRGVPVRRVAAALALATLIGACGSGGPVVEGTPTPLGHERILGVDVAVHGTTTVTRRTTTIEAMDYYFTPTILRAGPGAKILVIFRNGGFTTHNFSIPSLGISRDVHPGDLREANVVFPSSGVIAFFCRFHRATSAMIGAFEADAAIPTPK